MRTNNSPAATRTVACPKCAGTGIVTRFLDYHGGECFDCNGTGRQSLVTRTGKARNITVKFAELEVGLVVRATTAGAEAETITSVDRHPEFPIRRIVTTDAGNTYDVTPIWAVPLYHAGA